MTPTSIVSCDGHQVFEYKVEINRCCLLQANPDSRSGWIPAQMEAFEEEYCFVYDLDIQAVIGNSYERDIVTGACNPVGSANISEGTDFWGWHSTDIEACNRQALTTTVTTDGMLQWLYGPWVDAQPVCSVPPVNMSFELYTDNPEAPPECTVACCAPDGSCTDLLLADCNASGGTSQGLGTSCATAQCPQPIPEACCFDDGSCQTLLPDDCLAQIGTPQGPWTTCWGDLNTNGIDDFCEEGRYLFEFSLDIGSDTELSDPVPDGNEAFDPGDVYWWRSAPVDPPGRDGFKDDATIFGTDPNPDPPDPSGTTAVPVGMGTIEDYANYFDLDAHDQTDFDLHELQLIPIETPLGAPIPEFGSMCLYVPDNPIVSFDDDMGPGWTNMDVPVTAPSPMAGRTYGTTARRDEISGVILATPVIGPPPYPLQAVYPIADEEMVHTSLVPNPDAGEEEDDDVDSLDIVEGYGVCPIWYFSADHEAHNGLDPGDIYQVTASGPVKVIDESIHLGVPEDADIDAFEFVWLEEGGPSLAVLFSVDEDDPVTPTDESGGLDPTMIYASFLMGFHLPFTDPLPDDVDALTCWHQSLAQPCPGDCNWDLVVDLNDYLTFESCMTGPTGGGLDPWCECVDLDTDNNVDLVDFAIFQTIFGSMCP